MVGPLSSEWATLVHCSPLGLVPKGVSGKWRVIVDLSSPWGRSVNAAIDQDLCSLRYASLDNAIDLVRKLGRGTQMVKMDLKDAYRMVPVHPHNQHLLGISWQGSIYVDRCLPFGLHSAPKIFTAVADALASALFCRGIRFLMHYLDDYLFLGAPGTQDASRAAAVATDTFQHLGVPVSAQKD